VTVPVHAPCGFEPTCPSRRHDDARGFLRDALAELRREPGLFAITVSAPPTSIEAPLRALRKGPSWVFAGSEGPAIAAWGVAQAEQLQGTGRFAAAREFASAISSGVRHLSQPEVAAPPPRAFFGFAFAPKRPPAPPWESFGDGWIVLPRWIYAVEGQRASLTLIASAKSSDERLALSELEAWLDAIGRRPVPPTSQPRVIQREDLPRARWNDAFDAVRDAIARGDAHKIVLARRSVLTASTDFDPLDVLVRLNDRSTRLTRFAVRLGRTSFVGATPEHLFRLRGTNLTTEALAGSIAADVPRAAETLLASAKDRAEHAFVVRHLVDRLAPLSTRIAYPETPDVLRLPTVLHLRTPIEAELDRPIHPFDLVAALHPTPAVGGTPPERALAWIATHESAPRGWYGGPLGWIDTRGAAEVIVALRCGVIQGARAWLWAGSGIVAGSDPAREWEETALKLHPMLRALGVAP
jgi:isochorismate synthase